MYKEVKCSEITNKQKIQKHFCVVKVLKIICVLAMRLQNTDCNLENNTSVKVDDISLNSILIFYHY